MFEAIICIQKEGSKGLVYIIFLLALIHFLVMIFIRKHNNYHNDHAVSLFFIYNLALPVLFVFFNLYITKTNRSSQLLRSCLDFLGLALPQFEINLFSYANTVRIINVCLFIIPCFAMLFSLEHCNLAFLKRRFLKINYLVFTLIFILLFDPFVWTQIYYAICPDLISFSAIVTVQQGIEITSRAFCWLSIIISNLILLFKAKRTSFIRGFFLNDIMTLLCHMAATLCYLWVFRNYPVYFFKANKVIGKIRYLDIGYKLDPQVQRVFTFFFSLLFIVLIFLWMYRASQALSTVQDKARSGRGDADVFAKIFSHYVKNELLVMRGLVQNALDLEDPEEKNFVLKQAELHISEIYNHTNRLHDLMSIRKVVFKQLTVDDWLGRGLDVFAQQCPNAVVKKDIRFHGFITIDSLLLGETLVNLLKNSYEAIELFKLSEKNVPDEIELSIFDMDDWLFVQVTDHGIGMDNEQIRKAFHPFFSTKKTKTNWGIGLYTCRKVVQLHHGYIEIISNIQTLPRKTTVTLALPVLSRNADLLHISPETDLL